MRHATLFVCSTAHLPVAERRHIDHLIAVAPRGADGRVEVGHPDLVIEPYAYGFFVNTCVVGCGGEAPELRPDIWEIQRGRGRARGRGRGGQEVEMTVVYW